jgi:universal stress protein E
VDRFRNILAVYGTGPGSDDVLLQATCIARRSGAHLTIVDATSAPKSRGHADEARRRLSRLEPWLAQQGIRDAHFDVVLGTPEAGIVQRVYDNQHDLVIVSGEGDTALREFIFGSLAANLLLKCPCAVWVLKPAQSVPCASVAAALQLGPDDATASATDRQVLGLSASLARSLPAQLHLIHFWDVTAHDDEMLRSEIRDSTRREILDRNEAERRAAVQALLDEHAADTPVQDIHLPRGRSPLHLPRFADRLDVDVLVIGATARLGLNRLLRGNTAEAVLHGVRCSVLAVKPASTVAGMAALPRPSLSQQARAAVW